MYLCADIRKGNRQYCKKWFPLVLFTSYVTNILFFTHTHIINHKRISIPILINWMGRRNIHIRTINFSFLPILPYANNIEHYS